MVFDTFSPQSGRKVISRIKSVLGVAVVSAQKRLFRVGKLSKKASGKRKRGVKRIDGKRRALQVAGTT